MNKRLCVAIAACGLASGILAEEVQFSDTPKSVQNTVNRNLNGGVVKTIDKKVKDGRTVYDVAIRREGKDKDIRVDADGKLMASDTSAAVNITTDKNDGKILGVVPAPSHDDKTVKGEANVGDHKVKIEGNVDTQNDRDLNKNRSANAESKFKVHDYGSTATVETDSGNHKIIHKGDGKLLGFIPWKKPQNKMEVEVKTDSDSNVGAPPSSSSGTK
jgi:hypothetical protein